LCDTPGHRGPAPGAGFHRMARPLELEPDEEQQVSTRSTRRREPRDASNPGPPSMTPPVVTVDGARRASRRTTGSPLTGSLGTAAEALAATWDLVAACKFVHAKKERYKNERL
jgi:hypothetical protein